MRQASQHSPGVLVWKDAPHFTTSPHILYEADITEFATPTTAQPACLISCVTRGETVFSSVFNGDMCVWREECSLCKLHRVALGWRLRVLFNSSWVGCISTLLLLLSGSCWLPCRCCCILSTCRYQIHAVEPLACFLAFGAGLPRCSWCCKACRCDRTLTQPRPHMHSHCVRHADHCSFSRSLTYLLPLLSCPAPLPALAADLLTDHGVRPTSPEVR